MFLLSKSSKERDILFANILHSTVPDFYNLKASSSHCCYGGSTFRLRTRASAEMMDGEKERREVRKEGGEGDRHRSPHVRFRHFSFCQERFVPKEVGATWCCYLVAWHCPLLRR